MSKLPVPSSPGTWWAATAPACGRRRSGPDTGAPARLAAGPCALPERDRASPREGVWLWLTAQARRPLRVVMLINLFMPEVFAGGEQQCLRLPRALLARGVGARHPHQPVTPGHRRRRSDAGRRGPSPLVPGGAAEGRPPSGRVGVVDAQGGPVDRRATRPDRPDPLPPCQAQRLDRGARGPAHRRALRRSSSARPVRISISGASRRKRFVYGRLAAREIRDGASAFVGTKRRDDGRSCAATGSAPTGSCTFPTVWSHPTPVGRKAEASGP